MNSFLALHRNACLRSLTHVLYPSVMLADNPWFVGFNLICGLDNAFILGYSFLIMSFLGWAAGSVLFIVGMCICFYCNCVTGTLHTLGGHRNIHFRDLARTGFGNIHPYYKAAHCICKISKPKCAARCT